MPEYSQKLAYTFRKTRLELRMTQEQVAEKSGVDVRTVINIEKGRGKPKLEKLFPLVNVLKVDARSIFDFNSEPESATVRRLRFLADQCNEEEAAALLPVIESVLSVLRSDRTENIDK